MDLTKLQEPFVEKDYEWRLQSCGKSGKSDNPKIWGICLCYVTNRAIMNRLDEVVGAENWQNSFEKAPDGGIMCGIGIWVNDKWVWKYDGAENTDVEAVKGGLSSSMKRAGVQWGIGRLLYNLPSGFVKITEKSNQNAHYGKTKDGTVFYWLPPELPYWAVKSTKPLVADESISQEQTKQELVQDTKKFVEEVEAEKEKKQQGKTKNYQFLRLMDSIKKSVGGDKYYKKLRTYKVTHANEITDRTSQIKIYKEFIEEFAKEHPGEDITTFGKSNSESSESNSKTKSKSTKKPSITL